MTGCLPEPLTGPEFSTYAADEVAWLLTDLSGVALEATRQQRQQRRRAGEHYAESLPMEYPPPAEYLRLFHRLLHRCARHVAYLVGVLTERTLATCGTNIVLVSLARAGTPVGILMRRWALRIRQLALPHYSLSIVRDRGLDPLALRYLAARHDPRHVVFVDGWTGKGTITRELVNALTQAWRQGYNFPRRLVVLADPGQCADIYGTRQDVLVPSACLNATISGLVSRTVVKPSLLGPDSYHGAKFYPALGEFDVSELYLSAVSEHFPFVASAATAHAAKHPCPSASRPFAGWAEARRLASVYGARDVDLIKPGIGETSRALLRRSPRLILLKRTGPELPHIVELARMSGTDIVRVADMRFSCAAVLQPVNSVG
ncbi:MAG: hypothetical protein JO100_08950 [Pseudonocardia sp.]|nr:hypothetical protein [Pseudonocardia sp.]